MSVAILENIKLWDLISTIFFSGIATLVIVLLLMLIRWKTTIPEELFRKLMHFTAILITPLCLLLGDNYWCSGLALLIYAICAEVGLRILAMWDRFSDFFVERDKGEIRRSFVLYCVLQASLIIICGMLGDTRVIFIEILVWGLGDASAALIGKKWGKKNFRIGDTKKTYLGSVSMLAVSFIICIVCFAGMYDYNVVRVILQSLVIAILATATELLSKKGTDTATIPVIVTAACMCANALF